MILNVIINIILVFLCAGYTSLLFASEVNLSGYVKSYNIRQDKIDVPPFVSAASFQTQNSLRLTLEGFGQTAGVDSVWQLHYEVSPIVSSANSVIDNNTLAGTDGSYRFSDIRSTIGAESPKRRIQQNLDRFNLQLNFESGDLTIGRQAISFGAARFINPTDVFIPFDVRTFNTEYRTGIDAVRFPTSVWPTWRIRFWVDSWSRWGFKHFGCFCSGKNQSKRE